MVKKITHSFPNVIAFEFYGKISKDDFTQTIIPSVESLIGKIDEINLVYLLNTELSQFTLGAWWEDALLGMKNITKWHKSAIVTDSDAIQKFTELFSNLMPGEFKGFDKEDINDALLWASI